MKKFFLIGALSLSFLSPINAQHRGHQKRTVTKKSKVVAGLGAHRHPVSTTNTEAQKFFDQGLNLVFAFNHEEAIRSFQRAAELDPNLAMAYWGVGLALGPNINLDVDPEREKAAYAAAQKAVSLARHANDRERAYISALAKRYSDKPGADLHQLAVAYKDAMGELTRRFPDDLDAATLYAESIMNLRPWKLWTPNGEPAEGTTEAVAVLESVLKRNPMHPGANHYYIHAIEASPFPERALPSARRLMTLVPGAGHLVHMPAHVFMRTGNYSAASLSNQRAAEVDRKYFAQHGKSGMYPLMYYLHNLHFLSVAAAMEGRSATSLAAARELDRELAPHLHDDQMVQAMLPMLELFVPTMRLMLIRFHQWNQILTTPTPDSRLASTAALHHFARGMALASLGRRDEAKAELQSLREAEKSLGSDYMVNLNSGAALASVAEKMLAARIAAADGETDAAINLLQAAVGEEDRLAYDEPPAWYLPSREALGALLLKTNKASEAESVFRSELKRAPNSGRALMGLALSLERQHKSADAVRIKRQARHAWRNADVALDIEAW